MFLHIQQVNGLSL